MTLRKLEVVGFCLVAHFKCSPIPRGTTLPLVWINKIGWPLKAKQTSLNHNTDDPWLMTVWQRFFNFTVVQKQYALRNCTMNFDLFTGYWYSLVMVGSNREPQLSIRYKIKRINNPYLQYIIKCIFNLGYFQLKRIYWGHNPNISKQHLWNGLVGDSPYWQWGPWKPSEHWHRWASLSEHLLPLKQVSTAETAKRRVNEGDREWSWGKETKVSIEISTSPSIARLNSVFITY